MTAHPPLLLDTCAVLSLYASRRMEAILSANHGPFLIARAVLGEALYISVVIDGGREKEPVSLDPLLASGMLAVVQPDTEEESRTLIDLSLALDDGEAMTCAIALHRGYRVVTDEKKTIRLIGNQIPIVGTLDLVRAWANDVAPPRRLIQDLLAAIQDRGDVPGPDHAHRTWWEQMIGGGEC